MKLENFLDIPQLKSLQKYFLHYHIKVIYTNRKKLNIDILLNYEPERTVLVLNHSYQHSNYNLKDVERALGQPITQEIEHAPTQVTTSLNRGIPLVVEYKSSPTAQSILKLARHLAQRNGTQETEAAEAKSPQPAPKAKERKRRGLLFRRQATPRTG